MPHQPPEKIRIGGITLAVRIEPTLESWGEYHADKREITLASRTLEKRSTLRETLRHEMMHAALDISGINYSTAKITDMEETLCRCIDNIFHPAWERVRIELAKTK
jgi:hypothetical protein